MNTTLRGGDRGENRVQADPKRFLFSIGGRGYYRFFERPILELAAQHSVAIWLGSEKFRQVSTISPEMVLLETRKQVRTTARVPTWLFRLRELANFSIYFAAAHPAKNLAERWIKYLPERDWHRAHSQFVGQAIRSRHFRSFVRWLNHNAPADTAVSRMLRDANPDLLIATPYLTGNSWEAEYIRNARRIGVRTCVVVASWDNLTTKGTFSVLPDYVIAWNESLATEATKIHAVPRSRIVITGAPVFDYLLESTIDGERSAFCQRVGLRNTAPFLLYLGSSRSIHKDETDKVRAIARALRSRHSTQDWNVLVRPHPFHAEQWTQIDEENVCVWPASGAVPDATASQRDFVACMRRSLAICGGNTTALIEAAALDRPCISLVDGQPDGLGERGHFHHLLNAGITEIVREPSELVNYLELLALGDDNRRTLRRQFTRSFVRPLGPEKPASPLLVKALLHMADGLPAAQVQAKISGIP